MGVLEAQQIGNLSYRETFHEEVLGLVYYEGVDVANSGDGNVTATLSIKEPTTKVSAAKADVGETVTYTLQGALAQAGTKGFVIENGKKIFR